MPDGSSNAGGFLTASDQLGPTANGSYIPLPKAGPTSFAINGAAIFPVSVRHGEAGHMNFLPTSNSGSGTRTQGVGFVGARWWGLPNVL